MKKKNLILLLILLMIGLIGPAIIYLIPPNNKANEYSGKRVVEYLSDEEKKILNQNTKVYLNNKKEVVIENNSKTNFTEIKLLDKNKKELQNKYTNKGTFKYYFDISNYSEGTYYIHYINFNSTLVKQFIIKKK